MAWDVFHEYCIQTSQSYGRGFTIHIYIYYICNYIIHNYCISTACIVYTSLRDPNSKNFATQSCRSSTHRFGRETRFSSIGASPRLAATGDVPGAVISVCCPLSIHSWEWGGILIVQATKRIHNLFDLLCGDINHQ